MGILFGFLSMLGWGIADFLAAKSSRKIGFIFTLLWAEIFSFFISLIYFIINFQNFNINDVPKFLILLAIIGFLYTVGSLAFYKGLKEGQVSLVSPIGSSFALVIVILSVLFLKEILKINQIIGIFLIILGLPLLSIKIEELRKVRKIGILPGIKEGLMAMLGWGLALFLVIPVVKTLDWFLPTFLFRLFGTIFLLGYIFISKQSFKLNFQPSLLILLLAIGLLNSGAAFSYNLGVKEDLASIVASISASFPLVTILLAKIFLKEKLSPVQILGIIGVISGLILISI